jgi:SseB protein N-terminal domain
MAMRAPDGGAGGSPAGGGLPQIVVVPARQDIRPGHEADVIFEVRQLADGGRALPAFTTVGRLVSALGREQPWVALPLQNIQAIMGSVGVDRVVLDPQADPGAWRWRASDLEALERRQ